MLQCVMEMVDARAREWHMMVLVLLMCTALRGGDRCWAGMIAGGKFAYRYLDARII